MKNMLKPAALIVLAMVAGAIALVALISVAQSVNIYARTPEDFLPERATVLLMKHPTEDAILFWKERIPTIETVQTATAIDVAVIQVDGSEQAIAFSLEDKGEFTAGIYSLSVSDPGIAKHVQLQNMSLKNNDTFKSLRSQVRAKTLWMYMSPAVFQQKTEVDLRMLHAVLQDNTSPRAVSFEDETVSLSTPAENTRYAVAPASAPHMENRIFALSFANAADALDVWKKRLTANDAIILESLLRSTIKSLGADVSFTYDVVPLLSEPGVLQISASGSSTTRMLSGTHAHTKKLSDILERMHTSYAATLNATEVTSRVLDARFSTTDLRYNDDMVQKVVEDHDGWFVESTKKTDAEDGLFTAIQGNAFIITDTKAALLDAIRSSDPLPIPDTNDVGRVTSRLYIEPDAVSHMIRGPLPQLANLLVQWEKQPIEAVSLWHSGVQTFTLRNVRNPFKLLDSLL